MSLKYFFLAGRPRLGAFLQQDRVGREGNLREGPREWDGAMEADLWGSLETAKAVGSTRHPE